MKDGRQLASVEDVGNEGPGNGLYSIPGDDHQAGGTMREIGEAVHEESASEPVMQATVVAHEELPGCAQNTMAHEFSHLSTEAEDGLIAPIEDGEIQTDEDKVVRRVACHRRGRSMGDGGGSVRHSPSPDRGRTRVLNRVRKQNHLDFLPIMEPIVSFNGRFMARRLGFHDAICDNVARRDLWDALRTVSVGASPWIVGGDFNTVLSLEERFGGAASSSVAMSDFHDVIADYALVDAGYTGSPYTWYISDAREWYGLALAEINSAEALFEGLEQGCLWDVVDRVVEAERSLKEVDEAYDLDLCDRTLTERNRCSAELVRALDQEEAFWKQKARIKWAKDGERNTRYSIRWL
ncbi:UNVERIFIED_CONTAM: hypothetical protein Sradi_0684900 [Sesamum radiatum]|uniref:Endonuclease/exonuclease/phosphatase domain-containing protein n=1 Tax=Sesamum radiatum TaxID=300843 RepID=A0AAW2VNI3_SESRA